MTKETVTLTYEFEGNTKSVSYSADPIKLNDLLDFLVDAIPSIGFGKITREDLK